MMRGRRSRVVLTPRRWRQAVQDDLQGDGGKKARFTRKSTKEAVKTVARGKPDCSGRTCGDYARMLFSFAYEAAGAA
jgi:hypothetical protein